MRSLIVILVTLSFLQGALFPVNFVLLVILGRTFVVDDRQNYWLAFGFGLLLSLLSGYPLGGLSMIYLFFVTLVSLIKKVELSSHWVVIFSLSLFILFLNQVFLHLLFQTDVNLFDDRLRLLIEALLILPVYFVVRIWEERFIPRSDIRLKIGK